MRTVRTGRMCVPCVQDACAYHAYKTHVRIGRVCVPCVQDVGAYRVYKTQVRNLRTRLTGSFVTSLSWIILEKNTLSSNSVGNAVIYLFFD